MPSNTQHLSTIQNTRAEVLYWDGRLDNRDDLLLRLSDSLKGESSNQDIARAAYDRWGNKGFVHLIGDWSLVIRDQKNKTTVLASDFAGVRPLYYHVQNGDVQWSNRLQSLVEETGITDLDEQYIAGFLTIGGYANRTPYKGIYSVPPGHVVCVSSKGTSISRFWSMPISDTIQYRNEHRYEEELRALFREAVAVRLQTKSPVLAELSGGLDSSSVVCMANNLIRSEAVKTPLLETVSFTWQNSLDEPFIREVESHCGIKGARISTHEIPLIAERQVNGPTPEAFHALLTSLAKIASQLGAGTILTGQLGDLTTGNWFDDSLQIATSLRRFKIGQACEEALEWSKLLRLPIYRILWRAAQAALPPSLTPAAIYTTSDGSYAPKSLETSLLKEFSNRTAASEPTSFFSNDWLQAVPERRKYFYCLSMALELRTLQPPEPIQHLDYTHPFSHRPLVEFLMTIPVNVLCRPGEPRKLMRSAFSNLWPSKLRERRSKGSFNAPWQAASRPLARALLKSKKFHSVEQGFVDQTSLRSRLERLCLGLDCNEAQLRQIILLELWLRNRANTERSAEFLKVA